MKHLVGAPIRSAVWVGSFILLCACSTAVPLEGAKRKYTAQDYDPLADKPAYGSLWRPRTHGLFEDVRARRLGDVLTVRVDEVVDASRNIQTNTSRDSSSEASVSSFIGAMQKLVEIDPDIDPANLIAAATKSEFAGKGSLTSSGRLIGTLPVRIKEMLPNGDVYVEGRKHVTINDESSTLYISGVARIPDIDSDNSISSSVLADVSLSFEGHGVLSERQKPGWLARLIDRFWPF